MTIEDRLQLVEEGFSIREELPKILPFCVHNFTTTELNSKIAVDGDVNFFDFMKRVVEEVRADVSLCWLADLFQPDGAGDIVVAGIPQATSAMKASQEIGHPAALLNEITSEGRTVLQHYFDGKPPSGSTAQAKCLAKCYSAMSDFMIAIRERDIRSQTPPE